MAEPSTEQHGDAPSYWITYFTALPDTDVVVGVCGLGGEMPVGPLDIGAGRISVFQDSQGVVFAISEGETDN